ncbi:hypothetical protein Tco_0227242 [Tanacetum coccineum]
MIGSGSEQIIGLEERSLQMPTGELLFGHVWAPKWLEHVDGSECTFLAISFTRSTYRNFKNALLILGYIFGHEIVERVHEPRSSSFNLVPPFSDPESVIQNRQRNLGDPSLLLEFKEINMNTNNVQGPLPAEMFVSADGIKSFLLAVQVASSSEIAALAQ